MINTREELRQYLKDHHLFYGRQLKFSFTLNKGVVSGTCIEVMSFGNVIELIDVPYELMNKLFSFYCVTNSGKACVKQFLDETETTAEKRTRKVESVLKD